MDFIDELVRARRLRLTLAGVPEQPARAPRPLEYVRPSKRAVRTAERQEAIDALEQRDGAEVRVSAPVSPAPRQPNGEEYPPDILFLAEFFGHTPEFVMRNPHTYANSTHGTGDPNSGHIDPCKLLE